MGVHRQQKHAAVEKATHPMGYMASPALCAGEKKLLLLVAATLMILQHGSATGGADNSSLARPGCKDKCGNVNIPYPFGIGEDCFREGFEVYCPPHNVPKLNTSGTRLLEINLASGEARVENNITEACDIIEKGIIRGSLLPVHRWFTVSKTKNVFTAIGCSAIALIGGDIATAIGEDEGDGLYSVSACGLFCLDDGTNNITDCSGRGCCQSAIPSNLKSFSPTFYNNTYVITGQNFTRCNYAFVAERDWFNFDPSYVRPHVFERKKLNRDRPTLDLDWVVGNATCEVAKHMGSSYACAANNSECIDVTGVAATAVKVTREIRTNILRHQ